MFESCYFFFFKQKTAYEMRISDWSSDVYSSDLLVVYKKIGRLVAEDQNDRECAEFLETAPVRKKIDAINEQHRTAAQQNGKDQAAKDDGDGPIFRTDTRLRQLGLRVLHLIVLKHLQALQEGAQDRKSTRLNS